MGFRGKHKNKRDANEKSIVDTLRALGISVYHMDQPVDLACGFNGRDYLVEIKMEGAPLTKAQLDFYEEWRGSKTILRSIEDALEWAREVRGE